MSETALVNQQTGEILEGKKLSFTSEQIQLLKRTACKDATDDEFAVFLNVCQKVQLDPFAKQIFAVKYKGQLTTQTSIDGLRLIADRTGRYAPGKAPSFTYNAKNELESATAYVMKKVGDSWFEGAATAYYKEYVNSYNQLWQKLPHAMLAKCAESLALRRAFPNETNGLYAKEEMDQMNSAPVTENKYEIKKKDVSNEIERKKETVVDSAATPADHYIVDETSGGSDIRTMEDGVRREESKTKEKPLGTITDAQRKRVFAIMKSVGLTEEEIKNYILVEFAKESTRDLHWKEMNQLVEWMQSRSMESPLVGE